MKTIAALAALGAVLLVLGQLAYAGDHDWGQAPGVFDPWAENARTRLLPADQDRHTPLICLDSYPVVLAAAGDFRHTFDEPECRPIDRDVRP